MHPGLIALLAFSGTAGAVAVGAVVVERINAPEPTEQAQSVEAEAERDVEVAAVEPEPQTSVEAAPEVEPDVTIDMPQPQAPVLDIVRIEPTGEVLIAGSAEPGTRIGLLYNNELFAETQSEQSGDFVLLPDNPLPPGEGTLSIVVIDEDGSTLTISQEQVAVVVPETGSEDGFLVGIMRSGQPIEIVERQAPEVVEQSAVQIAQVQESEVQAAEMQEAQVVETPDAEPLSELEIVARIEPAEPAEPEPVAPAVNEAPQALPELEIVARIEPEVEQLAVVAEPAPIEDPVIEPEAPQAFVLVDAIELEGLRAWIAGGGLPGTVVRLYQDNELLGETLVGEQGRFLYEGQLMPGSGETVIRADVLAQGSADVLARAEVPFEMPVPELEVAATVTPQPTQTPQIVTETPLQPQPANTELAALATESQPAAPVSSERISVLDTGQVIIRRGDNLWRLSRRVFGLGVRYTSIYDANREQIRSPDLIFPGQVFALPTPDEDWGEVPGFEALEPDQIPPENGETPVAESAN